MRIAGVTHMYRLDAFIISYHPTNSGTDEPLFSIKGILCTY